MPNDFYNHDDGYPAFNAQGASAAMRAELDKIAAAFNKFASFIGKAGYAVVVNATGDGLDYVQTTGTGNVVRATDPTFTLTDITLGDASTTKHGWMQKYPGDGSKVLNGQGNFVPMGTTSVLLSSRTANAQITAADQGTIIDITSGTFTQTFAAVASLANGFFLWLRNSGTGDITLDPNGAELIDGLTSYVMYPGEIRLIQCDGTKLTSLVLKGYRRRFQSSATWVKPPGYTEHGGKVGSGGASGVKGSAGTIAQGGNGGGTFPFQIPASQLGATEAVSIGAGGSPQTLANTGGNSGGNSSLGAFIMVSGATSSNSTGIGTSFPGSVSINGTPLQTSTSLPYGFEASGNTNSINAPWAGGKSDSTGTQASGNSIEGGGAGGGVTSAGALLAPGVSQMVGAGGVASAAGNGVAGTAPCGGGGATQTGAQSGAGANGFVDIWGVV